jgi:hypothetical protein
VHETGSRSQQVATFMLADDVMAFDAALAPSITGLARWQTHRHPATVTPHDSLTAALQHDGVQAFLRLLDDGGGATGPIIQYLQTMVSVRDDTVHAGGRRYRPLGAQPEEMQPGRIAFKWFPGDEPESVRRDFALLTDIIWKALRTVSAPHLANDVGRTLRRYRIGPAAEQWARNRSGLAIRDGGLRLTITP